MFLTKLESKKVRRNWVTAVAVLVTAVCWTWAFATAWTAAGSSPQRTLSPSERQEIGRVVSKREAVWENSVQRRFPGDSWSQDDDFHASELRWARGAAAFGRVSVGEVLRAIDEDLRARGAKQPLRRNGAAPCKPRPFYD